MNGPDPLLPGDGIPVAPSMEPSLAQARVPRIQPVVDGRVALVSALAVGLGLLAGIAAAGRVRGRLHDLGLRYAPRDHDREAGPAGGAGPGRVPRRPPGPGAGEGLRRPGRGVLRRPADRSDDGWVA